MGVVDWRGARHGACHVDASRGMLQRLGAGGARRAPTRSSARRRSRRRAAPRSSRAVLAVRRRRRPVGSCGRRRRATLERVADRGGRRRRVVVAPRRVPRPPRSPCASSARPPGLRRGSHGRTFTFEEHEEWPHERCSTGRRAALAELGRGGALARRRRRRLRDRLRRARRGRGRAPREVAADAGSSVFARPFVDTRALACQMLRPRRAPSVDSVFPRRRCRSQSETQEHVE